jgi:hypothetical protein
MENLENLNIIFVVNLSKCVFQNNVTNNDDSKIDQGLAQSSIEILETDMYDENIDYKFENLLDIDKNFKNNNINIKVHYESIKINSELFEDYKGLVTFNKLTELVGTTDIIMYIPEIKKSGSEYSGSEYSDKSTEPYILFSTNHDTDKANTVYLNQMNGYIKSLPILYNNNIENHSYIYDNIIKSIKAVINSEFDFISIQIYQYVINTSENNNTELHYSTKELVKFTYDYKENVVDKQYVQNYKTTVSSSKPNTLNEKYTYHIKNNIEIYKYYDLANYLSHFEFIYKKNVSFNSDTYYEQLNNNTLNVEKYCLSIYKAFIETIYEKYTTIKKIHAIGNDTTVFAGIQNLTPNTINDYSLLNIKSNLKFNDNDSIDKNLYKIEYMYKQIYDFNNLIKTFYITIETNLEFKTGVNNYLKKLEKKVNNSIITYLKINKFIIHSS